MLEQIKGLVDSLWGSLLQFGWRDALDIVLVAVVVYQMLLLTKNTRAMQVLKGLGLLLLASGVSSLVGLTAITWILQQALMAGGIAVVVIFQPELRRALERIGRAQIFQNSGQLARETEVYQNLIKEMVTALQNLAARQVGALVVIEHKTGLGDIISTGTRIDGKVSAALLEQIFEPNTPLHDGAAIINGTKIVSAGCFLPLSDNSTISRQLGTRHRAALGISEVSDCLALIVSEETGVISLAREGKLTRYLDENQLESILQGLYKEDPGRLGFWRQWWALRRRENKDEEQRRQ